MKVVFLDYDGVLCNIATKYHHGDPECIKWLNLITDTTQAVIVVSSVWRLDGLKKNRIRLKEWGVNAKVVGVTPDLSINTHGIWKSVDRGIEIGQWVKTGNTKSGLQPYPIESIVILDDDSDMGNLLPRLVKTDSKIGLTQADALKAITILGQPQIPLC